MTDNGRVIDFDAFRREQNRQPVELKVEGETYLLPPQLPATVALDVIRARAEHEDDEDMPPEILEMFGTQIFGEDLFRTILTKHKMGLEEMGWLIQEVFNIYNKEIGVPNRKTRRRLQDHKAKAKSSR